MEYPILSKTPIQRRYQELAPEKDNEKGKCVFHTQYLMQ